MFKYVENRIKLYITVHDTNIVKFGRMLIMHNTGCKEKHKQYSSTTNC